MILDASGSMGHLADATIEGVNTFLDEQKRGTGEVRFTLTLFNTSFDVRFVAQPLQDVPPLGSRKNRYSASGGTALYDAVTTTIKGVQAWLDNHPHYRGDVVIVIQTDGEENSSQESTLDDVNALISNKIRQGWEFVFQGTGQAAWTEGQKFTAIPDSSKFAGADDDLSHRAAYAASSRAMLRKRASGDRFDDSLRAEGMPDEQTP